MTFLVATLITEGKAKQLYTTENEEVVRVHYLNQATALNGKRKESVAEKGLVNNEIDSLIFNYLNESGIKTHFIEKISASDQLVYKMQMVPLEVVIRNFASGSFQKKFQVAYLKPFDRPVHEYYLKSDALDDPFINESQIQALALATPADLAVISRLAEQVNMALRQLFAKIDIDLVDFKLEFGKTPDGEIRVADEISPDSCRLVDQETHQSLDKDVFRHRSGDVMSGYRTVLDRLLAVLN
ncbi:phosphoribosylaminoimidazolesuccinocarboxamide synthase [Secundilactobacillus kimchicus]|uniref:Phosphoribosylaminoimidazole-succinocarboxamide synthase n=1 Tax=Secundilactobacillus kimchicus JCM 15530 TaxID=1302272 RepID=A0A0R1HRI2_9LACO|nr:phosphoribosylaminoimidazolesuccinocarboxamide synthase [Secundilactobacillus kimchicus]KRK49096.1 phosphoribosylaminoimidazole-succinocarboxamide synthetase [Secundilactobacillus kimchicus JCM 15530]MBT9671421.1 phosphoribosylaminoimidazolesuccinocarboxamide synthase [Secundilactobacillus kimchicus]